MTIEEKISACKTMPELDALRVELTTEMLARGKDGYRPLQETFIKKKNQLLRIPLKERTW